MSGQNAFPRTAAVVVAAGQGVRAGQAVPKQFAIWRGKPVVRHSVEALINAGIAPIVVVVPAGAWDLAATALQGLAAVHLVSGGQTRQQSVRLGLEALAEDQPDCVLIHDAARPVLTDGVIGRLQAALAVHPAAIPVMPVSDSLAEESEGMMGNPADRARLRRVQTPQAFKYDAILAAHRGWSGAPDAGDDAQVAQAAGLDVVLVEGDEALHKLTFASDFAADTPAVRIGTGYDVHRLAEGEELWLCGIKIEHSQGLAGHSDADVAIHALVDALLGAIGAGDIGQHFPPGDAQWRGASSDRFLSHAVRLVADAGYAVGNVDVTIICEAPRIGPYRDAMRARLGELLGVDIGAVSVKATTTEKLGFTGREEGIAAQAVAGLFRN
ncbi:MAG: bifunctional 2-C-methyl-D-erythritol 4-phosphate cytidylyltransferase/2-C-methyl-D-erythritol 2,4-cyclodiphosphate synthase [Novosphingobium sp.]